MYRFVCWTAVDGVIKLSVLVDDAASKIDDMYIRSVCFSPDGKYLATGAEDKLIRVSFLSRTMAPALFMP